MPTSLRLDDVPDGASVFVDTNIFLYYFTATSPACRRFLTRVADGAIHCVFSLTGLLELAHRLMIGEAQHKGLIRGRNPARQLAKRPEIVKELRLYEEQTLSVAGMGVRIEIDTPEDVRNSFRIRRETGLMTADSMFVAVMQRLGIRSVASADRAFLSVGGVALYEPGDLG